VLQAKQNLLIVSTSKTSSVSKEAANITLMREVCPSLCQPPSKQVVICFGSSLFSATSYLATCIMEDSFHISNSRTNSLIMHTKSCYRLNNVQQRT
jgi:hypothetical protein